MIARKERKLKKRNEEKKERIRERGIIAFK